MIVKKYIIKIKDLLANSGISKNLTCIFLYLNI